MMSNFRASPGVGNAGLADALGVDKDEVYEAMYDLVYRTVEPPVRRGWARDETSLRHREHYYLADAA